MTRPFFHGAASLVALSLPIVAVSGQVTKPSLNEAHAPYRAPLAEFVDETEVLPSDDDLPTVIAEAYSSNPVLAARRYDLRATDDALGIALSRSRASVQFQVAAG